MSEPASSIASEVRLEYRGFRDNEPNREYVVRARLGLEERDYVVVIPHAAFADRRVSMADGPDVCFQHLRRELSGGVLADLGPLEISDEELASYRDSQKTVTRRRHRPAVAPPLGPDASS